MKIAIIALFLALAAPTFAADAPADKAPAEAQTQKSQADAQNPAQNATTEAQPGIYTCKFYTVKLPEGWKAIVPPEDQQGTVNAIFATDSGSAVVTMVAGPSGGADAKTIATMFAEQFKSPKGVRESNGQYTFTFPLQNGNATAIVTSSWLNFMVTTIAGNMKQAQKFLKENVSSENWPGLLPY